LGGQVELPEYLFTWYLLIYLSRYLDHAGDSEATFSIFQSCCHLLLPVYSHSNGETNPLSVLHKDTTSELAVLSSRKQGSCEY